jgi:chorismate mutase
MFVRFIDCDAEETIIFALIERANFRRNYAIYDPKHQKLRNVYGTPMSFLEYMLLETEKLHSKVRRYTSPEEHPFFPSLLPSPILPELSYPQQILLKGKGAVDVNCEIMRWYEEKIIDRLCVPGDDEQHGSSVLCDITALQALSRRIHYGKFVAESKFLKDPDTYTRLAHENNVTGIVDLLTNVEVEKRVLRRAFVKASTYGQDITGLTEGFKVEPMLLADIYRDMIIPLTKDVEVSPVHYAVSMAFNLV